MQYTEETTGATETASGAGDGTEPAAPEEATDAAPDVTEGGVAWEGDAPVFVCAVNDDGSYVIGRFTTFETYHGALSAERPA